MMSAEYIPVNQLEDAVVAVKMRHLYVTLVRRNVKSIPSPDKYQSYTTADHAVLYASKEIAALLLDADGILSCCEPSAFPVKSSPEKRKHDDNDKQSFIQVDLYVQLLRPAFLLPTYRVITLRNKAYCFTGSRFIHHMTARPGRISSLMKYIDAFEIGMNKRAVT